MIHLLNASLRGTSQTTPKQSLSSEIAASAFGLLAMTEFPSIANCLRYGIEFLASSGVPEPRISAETLLSYVLNQPRFSLYLDPDRIVEETKRLRFEALLTKRATRYPLQYLVRRIPFCGVTLEIGEGCLIPRPETEMLVEVVLKTLDGTGSGRDRFLLKDAKTNLSRNGTGTIVEVLDIGTGSGNIAISLASERSDLNVTATDISREALSYAKINAQVNSVENQVRFVETDLWEDIKNGKFDIIVSNPPYLTSDELEILQLEVRFEPRSSLDGGRDGLAFFRRIIQNAHAILKPNGFIFFEVGLGQAEKVCELFRTRGFHHIQCFKDDSQIDRIVSAQLS